MAYQSSTGTDFLTRSNYWNELLMNNVLTQNFGRMSFGGPFLAAGPTHVRTVLTG